MPLQHLALHSPSEGLKDPIRCLGYQPELLLHGGLRGFLSIVGQVERVGLDARVGGGLYGYVVGGVVGVGAGLMSSSRVADGNTDLECTDDPSSCSFFPSPTSIFV